MPPIVCTRAASARFRLVITVVAHAVVAPSVLFASSLYVAPSGDDANSCASADLPCRTINAAAGKATAGDTVFVAVGTYTGTGSEVVLVQKAIVVSGGWSASFASRTGYSIIDGENARRGIQVFTGSDAVTISGFIVEHGIRIGVQGGGLANNGNLTLDDCIIRNNHDGGVFNSYALTINGSVIAGNFNNSGGGGIENMGPLTINGTTISGNETTSEGGGLRISDGVVTITNSTISGNLAQFIGGAISNRTTGTVLLNYVTIAGNNALFGGGGIGYFSTTAATSLLGTIVAGNSAGPGGGHPDCFGDAAMTTRGHNLIGKGKDRDAPPFGYLCLIASTGDQIGSEEHPIDARLGPLADNGGPTPTHALLAASPAVDAGDDAACAAAPVSNMDQRGVNRMIGAGAHCDIGAFEKSTAFTDDPLIAGVTPIRAVHVTELRSRINAARIALGLAAYAWTDPGLAAGFTPIIAQHILDLRQALLEAYVAANRTPPTYTEPALTVGVTVVRVLHIVELRAAVLAIE